jgi:hypothetical protein
LLVSILCDGGTGQLIELEPLKLDGGKFQIRPGGSPPVDRSRITPA